MGLFHSHKHDHHHEQEIQFSSEERYKESQKVTIVSVVVNVLLVIAQITVGFIGKSQALIADGIHSLADLVCDFLVLFANHHSRKEADSEHPYGHKRIENATTLVLGIILIIVGVELFFGGIEKLMFANEHGASTVKPITLITAILSLLAKEGLFRYMLHVGNKLKSQMLIANAWHSRSDAASSLVVIAGIVGNLLGFTSLDLIASILIAVAIARMGWVLGYDALLDLIDRGLDAVDVAKVRQEIETVQGVLGVHEFKSRKTGDNVLIDVHILVDHRISVSEGHHIAELVRAKILKLKDLHVLDIMVHIDPENDHSIIHQNDLPERKKIESHILELLLQLGISENYLNRIDLHYLEGSISIEIILNKEAHLDEHQINYLKEALSYLNQVEIYKTIS